ncbi:LOW QUALITY PROTEIN: hypothetical protein KUTeg_021941 [Tegillarca granosa]|uniref:EF-hand domain-containing protein n=1 Tax=Tegillarca granosa TaxID=220873 RepID=A0ABQ9E962_TEGGR|nr:LOW QUALITY PROTEIN: hypothetical protein KUTeg_021941 [Tegillarca granosa]
MAVLIKSDMIRQRTTPGSSLTCSQFHNDAVSCCYIYFGFAYAAHPDFKPYNDSALLLFHSSDVNQDGDNSVSRHEYVTYLTSSTPTLHDFAHALYDDYDVTGDHHLTHQDFDLYYAKLDANGDGNVTQDEFVPYWTDPYNESAALLFHGSDLNADGIFSRQELDQVFEKYDANADGKVSRHEYVAYLTMTAPTLEQFAHALYDDYDVTGDHHLDHHDFDLYYAKLDADGKSILIIGKKTNHYSAHHCFNLTIV